MMPTPPTIRRILALKDLGVFHNFAAPNDLPDFQHHNLIYGFNGSGKTTLARVFVCLETGTLCPELPQGGAFEVELTDGTIIKSTDGLDALRGRVLVFDVDFIEENLRWKAGTAKPVFYLGKEQAELSKKLAEKEAAFVALEAKRSDAKKEHNLKDRAFNSHKRDGARLISEQLGLGRKYDATNLVADYSKGPYDGACSLSEHELKQIRAVITQDAPLAKRDALNDKKFDLSGLVREVRRVLDTTLGTMKVKDLREHETMLKWVKEGVGYHRTHNLSSCLFCAHELTEERMRALGQATDGKFDRLTREIFDAKNEVEGLRDRIVGLRSAIPSSNDISKELQARFTAAIADLRTSLGSGAEAVIGALALLEKKAATPNLRVNAGKLITEVESADWDMMSAVRVSALNAVIEEHNTSHDKFNEVQEAARAKLKARFLADGQIRYRQLESEVAADKKLCDRLDEEHTRDERELDQLKQDMRQHGPAADMINRMIHSYLGHKELEIGTLEDGYQLRRNGRPVTGSLSEGEKTAIALCYFLSTVEAEGRKRKDLIVVVDDPISSLDTKALNYAFSIIKAALSDVGQLIILTHNLHFMNETKKWLKKKTEKEVGKDKATATLLFLDAVQDEGTETR
jgi:wobble nucleotide-excising tRNase